MLTAGGGPASLVGQLVEKGIPLSVAVGSVRRVSYVILYVQWWLSVVCPLADRVCPPGLTEFAPCPCTDRVCLPGLTEFAPGLTERAGCTRGPPSPLQLVNSRSRDYYKAAADVGNADATVVDTGCNMPQPRTQATLTPQPHTTATHNCHTHRQH